MADQRLEAAQQAHADNLNRLRQEVAAERAQWQQQLDREKDRAAALETALSASEAEGERLSAALATEKERSDQAQAQADTLREQRDQLTTRNAQLDERCQALQAAVEQERARSDAVVTEKDARLGEQAAVVATFSAALQRVEGQGTGGDAADG